MTRAEAIRRIADEAAITQAAAARAFDAVIGVAIAALVEEDGMIMLPGLGRLSVISINPRTGRDMFTGEAVHIPAKNGVRFKPSALLKAALNPVITTGRRTAGSSDARIPS